MTTPTPKHDHDKPKPDRIKPKAHEVTMAPSGVTPLDLTVGAGEQVVFNNKTGDVNEVLFNPNPAGYTSAPIPPGGTMAVTFPAPGEFKFVFRDRPGIAGTVTVE